MVLKYVIITANDICSQQTSGIARQLLIIILVQFIKKKKKSSFAITEDTTYQIPQLCKTWEKYF